MIVLKLRITTFFLFTICCFTYGQQKNIELKAIVTDVDKNPIPYAAVGIPSKYLGTATTEDGTFLLLLSKAELKDSLEISSIGFKTYKIKVQDYIKQKVEAIVLEDDVVSLSEVNILPSKHYVKLAVKQLGKTTIRKTNQLNALYRRFSVEDGKARFLVEHYINVLDPGIVAGEFLGVEIVAGRKSADYRFIKKKLPGHPVNVIGKISNPLRTGFNQNQYNWKTVGDSSYDGEDIIIIEGRHKKKKNKYIKLYIGLDTYGVYRLETSILKSLYIYKKGIDGRLHLSYHNRTRTSKVKLTKLQQKVLKTNKAFVKESYKHEMYVLGVETNKKEMNKANYIHFKDDIGDLKVNYNPEFWRNFSLPPETEFYKKSKNELESIFGVSLEVQFKSVN